MIAIGYALLSTASMALPLRTSGNPYLDRHLRSWIALLNKYFDVSASLHFDTSQVPGVISSPNGVITITHGMLRDALDHPLSHPFLVYVLAHEWSHQLHFREGGDKIKLSVQRELQADCMGAFFLFTHRRVNYFEFANLIYRKVPVKGDPYYMPWWHPQSHGSAFQRSAAVQRGYQLAARSLHMRRPFGPWDIYRACRY